MPDFRSWVRDKTPSHPRHPFVERERGCPFDCGLCPDHAQHTCTGLIEVTGRCNRRCRLLVAPENRLQPEPSLERIAFQMDRLRQASGACNVQLSGGEPTVRDDLPEIIHMAKARGFALIQCNTNGLRLGTEPGYAVSLREAGLDSVYLQCDAADDAAHEILRGRRCLPEKLEAIGRAAKRESGSCWWRPWRRALTPTVCGRWWKWDCVWGHMSEACIFSPCLRSDVARGDRWRAARCDIAGDRRGAGTAVARANPMDGFSSPGCENALCSFQYRLSEKRNIGAGAGRFFLLRLRRNAVRR